jgi:hypothetical protein
MELLVTLFSLLFEAIGSGLRLPGICCLELLEALLMF